MNDPLPNSTPSTPTPVESEDAAQQDGTLRARSKAKPKPAAAVKSKIELHAFRGLVERALGLREVLGDEQVRFLQQTLEALRDDKGGTIRITLTPPTGPARLPARKFSKSVIHSNAVPQDDELRLLTRELALMDDEEAAFSRIDSLPVETLHRGAQLFGFKADTLVGLKANFASVVADIRQMENIATKKPTPSDARPGPQSAGGAPTAIDPQAAQAQESVSSPS